MSHPAQPPTPHRRLVIGMLSACVAVGALLLVSASAEAAKKRCLKLCRTDISGCVQSTCDGLAGKPKRKCQRACRRSALKACRADPEPGRCAAGGGVFDGESGTLWVLAEPDTILGVDTATGAIRTTFPAVGADASGNPVLMVGDGSLWYRAEGTDVRRLTIDTGSITTVTGQGGTGLGFGAGAIWTFAEWYDPTLFASFGQMFRHTSATGLTSSNHEKLCTNPYMGPIQVAASNDGAFSLCWLPGRLFVVLFAPGGNWAGGVEIPGDNLTMSWGALAAGDGRVFAVTHDADDLRLTRVSSIATNPPGLLASRDLQLPGYGDPDGSVNHPADHPIYGDGHLFVTDTSGQRVHELDPSTLATIRVLPTTNRNSACPSTIGAGALWLCNIGVVTRIDLTDGTAVEIPLPLEPRALAFQAP